MQNDIFLAGLLNINDINGSEIYISSTCDMDGAGNTASLKASRRFGESWRVEISFNSYWRSKTGDPTYSLRRDDYTEFYLKRFF